MNQAPPTILDGIAASLYRIYSVTETCASFRPSRANHWNLTTTDGDVPGDVAASLDRRLIPSDAPEGQDLEERRKVNGVVDTRRRSPV